MEKKHFLHNLFSVWNPKEVGKYSSNEWLAPSTKLDPTKADREADRPRSCQSTNSSCLPLVELYMNNEPHETCTVKEENTRDKSNSVLMSSNYSVLHNVTNGNQNRLEEIMRNIIMAETGCVPLNEINLPEIIDDENNEIYYKKAVLAETNNRANTSSQNMKSNYNYTSCDYTTSTGGKQCKKGLPSVNKLLEEAKVVVVRGASDRIKEFGKCLQSFVKSYQVQFNELKMESSRQLSRHAMLERVKRRRQQMRRRAEIRRELEIISSSSSISSSSGDESS